MFTKCCLIDDCAPNKQLHEAKFRLVSIKFLCINKLNVEIVIQIHNSFVWI